MKALFLGLGGIGQRHLRNLLRIDPETRIGAVRHGNRTFEIDNDLKAHRDVNIEEKYNIEVFKTIEDAVGNFKPDFAVVATPSNTHIPITTELIRHRIPVMLEKPISHSVDGLEELRDVIRRHGAPVMIAYPLRFNPCVRRLRELVQNRVLGRFYSLQVENYAYLPDWHDYESYRELYAARSDLGGGAIMTVIHLTDLLHWILGTPKRLWSVGGKLSSLDMDVEDTVVTAFEFELDGRVFPATMVTSLVQRPPMFAMTFAAENGKIIWNLLQNRIDIVNSENGRNESIVEDGIDWNDMFLDEMAHFLDCVKTGRTPDTALENVMGGHFLGLHMLESLTASEIVTL